MAAPQRKRNAPRGGASVEQDGQAQETPKRKTTKKGQTETSSPPAKESTEKPTKKDRTDNEQGEPSSPEAAPSVGDLRRDPATQMADDFDDDDQGNGDEMDSNEGNEENSDAQMEDANSGKTQGKKSQSQKAWLEAGEKEKEKDTEKRERIDLTQYETLANFDEESFEIKPTKVDIQKNLYLLLKYNEVDLKDIGKKYRYLAINFIRESGESQFMFSINRNSLDATIKSLEKIQTYLKNPPKKKKL